MRAPCVLVLLLATLNAFSTVDAAPPTRSSNQDPIKVGTTKNGSLKHLKEKLGVLPEGAHLGVSMFVHGKHDKAAWEQEVYVMFNSRGTPTHYSHHRHRIKFNF